MQEWNEKKNVRGSQFAIYTMNKAHKYSFIWFAGTEPVTKNQEKETEKSREMWRKWKRKEKKMSDNYNNNNNNQHENITSDDFSIFKSLNPKKLRRNNTTTWLCRKA